MNFGLLYGIGILFSSSLEMYNYMLFPFIQSFLMPNFYKAESQNVGFLIMFLAALSRPIGGLFFGYIGDKYGRKISLLISMNLMSFACFIIIFLPNYSRIGNFAIAGLIVARVLQVVSISGEHAGVAISLIEVWKGSSKGKFKYYGLSSGLVYLFSMFGTFLVTCVVSKISFENWRWAYFLSFILIIFCFLLRFLPYSDKFNDDSETSTDDSFIRNFFSCLCISATMSGLYYFNTVFMVDYFDKRGISNAKFYSTIYLFIYMFSTFFWGWVSDFFRKLYLFIIIPVVLMLFSVTGSLYFCTPLYHCVDIFLLAMYAGPTHSYFFKLFPKKYRYTGISFSYSLGSSLIGSSTPFIASMLINNINMIFLYLCFLSFLALSGVILGYKTLHNDL